MIFPQLLHFYYILQSGPIFNSISAHIPQFHSSSKQSKTPSQPPQRHLIPSLHFYFFHSCAPTFLLHLPPAPLQSGCQTGCQPHFRHPALGTYVSAQPPHKSHGSADSASCARRTANVVGLFAVPNCPRLLRRRAPARRTAGDEPFRHHLRPTGSPKTRPEPRVKEDSGHTMSGIFYCPAVSFYVQVKFSFPTSILKPRM